MSTGRSRWQLGKGRRKTGERSRWVEALQRVREIPEKQKSLEDFSNEVNALFQFRFPSAVLSPDDIATMIAALAACVDVHAAGAEGFAQFIVYAMRSEKATFSVAQLNDVLQTLIVALSEERPSQHGTVLKALGYVLFDNGDRTITRAPDLVPLLLRFLATNNHELQVAAATCIGNLWQRAGPRLKEYYDAALKAITATFTATATEVKQAKAPLVGPLKVLSASLRALTAIAAEPSSQLTSLAGPLIRETHGFTTFGIDDGSAEEKSPAGEAEKERASSAMSSDSSDTEVGSGSSKNLFVRIRVSAFNVVDVLARSCATTMAEHAHLFLPVREATAAKPVTPSLFTAMLFDPAIRVREAAAVALCSVVECIPWKKWLPLAPVGGRAQQAKASLAFSSLSDKAEAMIRQVHNGVTAVLARPPVSSSGRQNALCLQALVSLLSAVPYERVPNGGALLAGSISEALPFAAPPYEDTNVSIRGLTAIAAALESKDPFTEVAAAFTDEQPTGLLPVLLSACEPTSPSPVRMEAMATIAKGGQQYATQLAEWWHSLRRVLLTGFGDSHAQVRAHALRALDQLLAVRWQGILDQAPAQDSKEDESANPEALERFEGILALIRKYVWRGLFDTDPTVRAAALGCFAWLTPLDWKALSSSVQQKCIDGILVSLGDQAVAVRMGACKTIGTYLTFSEWRNATFVIHAMKPLMKGLKDPSMNVRVKILWAIGNLAAVPHQPAQYRPSDPIEAVTWEKLLQYFPPSIASDLVEALEEICDDHDRVVAGVTRFLGFIGTSFLRAFGQTNGQQRMPLDLEFEQILPAHPTFAIGDARSTSAGGNHKDGLQAIAAAAPSTARAAAASDNRDVMAAGPPSANAKGFTFPRSVSRADADEGSKELPFKPVERTTTTFPTDKAATVVARVFRLLKKKLSGGGAKVLWNSCHGFGLMFQQIRSQQQLSRIFSRCPDTMLMEPTPSLISEAAQREDEEGGNSKGRQRKSQGKGGRGGRGRGRGRTKKAENISDWRRGPEPDGEVKDTEDKGGKGRGRGGRSWRSPGKPRRMETPVLDLATLTEQVLVGVVKGILSVLHSPNFKARTSAAASLFHLQSRDLLKGQDLISLALQELLNARVQATQVKDFREFAHQDALLQQLDETVLRFITMLTPKEAGELPAVLRDEMSSWWSNNGRKFEGNASWMEAKQVLLAVEAQQNKK